MTWYQPFFQFTGIAEATIQHDAGAWLRLFSRGDGDIGQWIEDLPRPGALTASLNWYRANLAPRIPGPPQLPPASHWVPLDAPDRLNALLLAELIGYAHRNPVSRS